MILTSEEADRFDPGGSAAVVRSAPPGFVVGGDLAMRPSNMGIQSAAIASMNPVAPSTGARADRMLDSDIPVPTTPPLAPTRHPGTPLGGEHRPPSTHTPPSPQREPPVQRRRLDEEGDAVPGSQDAALADRAQAALSLTDPPERARRRISAGRPWEILRCTMCDGPDAFQALDSRGLMQHLARAHLGQVLRPEAIAQLRALDKAACRICGGIRARLTPHCSHCGCATATRPLQAGDSVPDRRRGSAATGPTDGVAASTGGGVRAAAPGPPDDQQEPVTAAPRAVTISDGSKRSAEGLQRTTLLKVPACVAARIATAWAETLEGCLAGDWNWEFLARFRSRLLLGTVPQDVDRNRELKRRLLLWEQGRFDELVLHVAGQQADPSRRLQRTAMAGAWTDSSEERLGKIARQRTAAGAISKAVKGLVGGIALGTPTERAQWTSDLIPRSCVVDGPCTRGVEAEEAKACAWGSGNFRQARNEMRAAGRSSDGPPNIPWVRLAPLSAAGPTGDRQEHLDDVMSSAGASQKRRLTRCLDEVTVRWATNTLPLTFRWTLNTLAIFLRKDREPTCKHFDDEEWLRAATEGNLEWMSDVPAADVVGEGREAVVGEDIPPPIDEGEPHEMNMAGGPDGPAAAPETPKVRPLQMGEFLRKWISRRLLRLSEVDIGRVMIAMRQLGLGTAGGAEALALFHQLIYVLWKRGALPQPLARIKVDEKNCFGMLEWPAVRHATRQALPRHYAPACWKHAATSGVEQNGVDTAPKDRGAEQGDVDGPLECSLTLGDVARQARDAIHARQRSQELPWTGPSSAAVDEYDARVSRAVAWEALAPEERRCESGAKSIIPDPRHEIQAAGGIADFWYLDDGDIMCDPLLVRPFLEAFDRANTGPGAVRNLSKSDVVYYVDDETLAAHAAAWDVEAIRSLARVSTADTPTPTLGVVTGASDAIEAQLAQKVNVVKGIQAKVAVCADTQTEHVLDRQSLGIGRVNHILRVHGHGLQGSEAISAFDRAAAEVKDRLFPGLTAESHDQASLAAAYGGLGWRRASDTALPANLGGLVMATPRVRSMAKAMVHAGLLREGQIEGALEERTRLVESAFLSTLDEVERTRAEEFLQRCREAAAEQWDRAEGGARGGTTAAPRPDATYVSADEHVEANPSTENDGDAPDVEGAARRLSAPHLQKELTRLADCTRLRALEGRLRAQAHWEQLERLRDLRHPEVSHQWLWHLDSRTGTVLAQTDYIACVQKRLGARIFEGTATCRLCGAPLDTQLHHSENCSTAEATRGHYACVRVLVEGFRLADPATTTEPRGLSDSMARPADILTNAAVPGRGAALDICVASSNAAAALGDAAEAAFRRKLRRYRDIIPQLAQAGIAFRPLVWTADGRPHPAATRTLQYAAGIAAAREGGAGISATSLLRRWRHELQVAIQRRRAAMARAVVPQLSARATWLLTGFSDEVPSSGGRAPPLDEVREAVVEEMDGISNAGWIDDDEDASLLEGATRF